MIVVDSSVWIASLRNDRSEAVIKLDAISDPATILVGDLVLFEILQGARDDLHAERLCQRLRLFPQAAIVDDGIAIAAARHFRALRREGVTVRKSIDLLIATFCIERDHMLLHQDRDFDMIARHLNLRIL